MRVLALYHHRRAQAHHQREASGEQWDQLLGALKGRKRRRR